MRHRSLVPSETARRPWRITRRTSVGFRPTNDDRRGGRLAFVQYADAVPCSPGCSDRRQLREDPRGASSAAGDRVSARSIMFMPDPCRIDRAVAPSSKTPEELTR